MDYLKKLLSRCNEMDLMEQIFTFDDAFLAANAQKELDALETKMVQCGTANDELAAQLAEAQARIADLQDSLNNYLRIDNAKP